MGGCHLFLQVFYLDHIDLGVYNKPKLVSPRIGLFDYESLKKMIDHLSAVNGIESSFFPPVSLAQDKQDKKDATSNSAAATRRQGNHLNVLTKTHASNTALSCSNPGPNDFARHLQVNPMHSASKTPVLLKEHNARILLFMNDFRRRCQEEMFSFADKLLSPDGRPCTCCTLAGRQNCVIVSTTSRQSALHNQNGRTPSGPQLSSSRKTNTECEESSTGQSPLTRKNEHRPNPIVYTPASAQ
ncbi:uncharacterized protein LOC112270084 [Brachypodium distachyon]|uniref:uncharacterized protein LOC112270084 n=1 Tax=Brachypodium distachyon TaxID=15368 RepID=UPI000D0E2604|nr:uncharacterized protein LOC112270084 [Brachypodium distachyon]|eukprot:XP_024313533.1 uncharacterized protein LOC112270084 [Brachypodium distachyon]